MHTLAPRPPPVWKSMSFWMNAALPQMAPATMSLAPLMNFVSECTTTCAPSRAGLRQQGAKVLSTTSVTPRASASCASAGMSATTNVGFAMDSV